MDPKYKLVSMIHVIYTLLTESRFVMEMNPQNPTPNSRVPTELLQIEKRQERYEQQESKQTWQADIQQAVAGGWRRRREEEQ